MYPLVPLLVLTLQFPISPLPVLGVLLSRHSVPFHSPPVPSHGGFMSALTYSPVFLAGSNANVRLFQEVLMMWWATGYGYGYGYGY